MSKLRVGEVANIRYSKKEDTTERVIIPTTVPSNIKALDVSGLPDKTARTIAHMYKEYAEYLKQHMKQAQPFEDFLEENCLLLDDVSLNWRTFKPESTEVL